MERIDRTRFVIDPVWKLVKREGYEKIWKIFLDDCERCGFIGFDMEWSSINYKPVSGNQAQNKKKPVEGQVATLQLSSLRVTFVVKFIDLFYLATKGKCYNPFGRFSKKWPQYRIGEKKNSSYLINKIYQDIVSLLQSDAVVKVGVGIRGDQVKLQRDYENLILNPCVDLVTLAQNYPAKKLDDTSSCPHENSKSSNMGKSLKAMSVNFTGKILNKDYFVILSNWGGALGSLSKMQINYAAEDAEASFDICQSIFVQAGLVANISSPSSISGTSCLSLLEPLILKIEKNAPKHTEKQKPPFYNTSVPPESFNNLLSSNLSTIMNDVTAAQGKTTKMMTSSVHT
ncbi:unnamed protein product [Phytomonas sp. Hart1]|nr:unnamed protein product [Phytomonas sp. Hart1]|eukprot:CCW72001.1 unnamed protein product [Phytomonas sp. isolate Hart1]